VVSGVPFSRFHLSLWALRRHGFLLYAHFSLASVIVHVDEHVQRIFGKVRRGFGAEPEKVGKKGRRKK
jgi:hypothetical protein